MKKILLATIAAALMIPCTVFASPLTDDLGKCLADNTSGKDRKDLAKWIFVAMASHPEMRSIAVVPPATGEKTQKTLAELFTRLIGTSCANEMRAVVKADGNNGVRIAFENLGRIAMQELMSNPQVTATVGGFERYIDKSKLESVLAPK